MGLQKSFAAPDSKYYQRKYYGYKHNEKGYLVIDEKGAEVVRLIFRMSKEGASLSQIAQVLQEQDIFLPRGNVTWIRETLRKILHNEKYYGMVILQKTFVANCLNHKQVKNTGQREQFVIVENHEAIIKYLKKRKAIMKFRNSIICEGNCSGTNGQQKIKRF